MKTSSTRRMDAACCLLALLAWTLPVSAQQVGGPLCETTFANGGEDWAAVNNATVSDFARRPGGKSLLIRQTKDDEANSAWLSPVLKNPGKPVRVSLWAADNYRQVKDFSFSAAFELVPCDQDGTLTSAGGDWTYIPWDDERQMLQFRHTMTAEGLLWKHYEAVKAVRSDHFRVRFCWPKSRMQGECHFTDLRVTVADTSATTAGAPATPDAGTAKSRYALEVTTGVTGNLFYHDDPLRFEFLLYPTDGQPIEALQNPVVRYEVTDYERHEVAAGALPFDKAASLDLKGAAPLQKRRPNLHLSALLPESAAREVGREFFLHAALMDGDRVLAEDTVTYGVVKPRAPDPEQHERCRFVAFSEGGGFRNTESKHEGQTLVHKMGVSLTHDWDYSGWKRAQPKKDDPITVKPGRAFPKLVYCPNLEQVRGRRPDHPWGDVARMAPDWAVLEDPFHPGCKTFDIDGYVRYIVAFVRANRRRVVQVVPSGLERSIDARTLELHRKAYAALKKEFPDLPVGMMVWGVLSADGVDFILKEKLYEVADFLDTHVYLSAVDWTEWERLRRELKKLGQERRLISTEFARVGGTDQLQRSRDTITSMLDAHAHDMYRITYFNMYAGNIHPLPNTVLRGEFPGDGFQWMQYVDRPRVSKAIAGGNWRTGLYGHDHRGTSLMPMLQCMAYYNSVQAVEGADFKCVFQPTPRSIAYVYARDGQTVCYLFLREPAAPATLALTGDVPYTIQDLYGRTDRVAPPGASLVVATLDPLVLLFEKEVPALYGPKTASEVLRAVDGGLSLPPIARGASASMTVSLPPLFARNFTATVRATVDGRWPKTDAQTVEVRPGQEAVVKIPLAVDTNTPPGSYTFAARLYDGDTLVSVLKQPLRVSELLTLEMRGVPMTRTQAPAIAVTVHSLADEAMAGTIRLQNRYFGAGFAPDVLERPYTVGPRGVAEVHFPVPRAQVNLASSYLVRATLRDRSGFDVTVDDDVSFQPCVKARAPITVDADLGDWGLDELLPIPFDRWHRGPRPPEEFSARFYTRWDEAKLYFALVVTDRVSVVTGDGQVSWNDDNVMFGLYPWGWQKGEPLNTGYYREHLGPIMGGGASFLRVGHVPSGPSTAEGAEIAVKRTENGYLYEWAYPEVSLYPLRLEKGGAFRLSMTVWDQHQVPKKGWGQYTWLTFAGFNTSVNAQPNLWRQFTMVED